MTRARDVVAFGKRHRARATVLLVAVGLVGMGGVSTLGAQGSTSIGGRIVGSAAVPLAGVAVTIMSLPDSTSLRTVTDAHGLYSAVFLRRVSRISMLFASPGFVSRLMELPINSGPAVTLGDIVLVPTVHTLANVTVKALRARVARADQANSDQGPGQSGRTPDNVNLSGGLTGDPTGSLAAALATLPFLSVMPGANGGVPTISAFGLSGGNNGTTLNGLSFGGTSVPPDGVTLQALTATYDPGKGGFSGFNTSLRFASGTSYAQRSIRGTLDAPSLQWSSLPVSQLLGNYRQGTVGGYASGNNTSNTVLYSTSAQLVRRESTRLPLASTDPSIFAALGIDRDSVQRILGVLSGLRIPGPGSAPYGEHSTSLTALSRLDYRPTPGDPGARGAGETGFSSSDDQLTALIGINATSSLNGPRIASLAATGSAASNYGGTFAVTLSRYLFGWLLNESSVSVQASENTFGSGLELPSANVRVTSSIADRSAGFSTLGFGGTGVGRSTTRTLKGELRNETAWYTADQTQQFKITLDAQKEGYRSTPAPSFGSLTYYSIDDLAANKPAIFARTTSPGSTSGQALNAALAFGDIIAPFRNEPARAQLRMQFGIRAEANALAPTPVSNPALASSFGIQTNTVPTQYAIEPMFGFTEPVGHIVLTPGSRPISRASVFGGVREYRSTLSASMLDPFLRQTGLSTGSTTLLCEGSAVPTPNWASYAEATGTIPSQCAGAATSQSVLSAPSVAVFAPDYQLTRSWRPALGLSGYLTPSVTGTLNLAYSRNLGLPDVVDRNFDPTVRFTLASEGNRPVFVRPAAIDPQTGLSDPGASRLSPLFSSVMETSSDLRQSVWQANGSLLRSWGRAGLSRVSVTALVGYAFMAGRDEYQGFSGTTAGDPRTVEEGASALARHTGSLFLSMSVPTWVQIGGYLRVASGIPFTPRVNGDVNGDGLVNDRPFIFNPNTTADPSVAQGMRALLATAPSAIRECLVNQLGQIAGRNSCGGPVTSSLTMTASPDSYRIHLGNRGTIRLIATNVLGGLDALLHGSSNLHGWGAAVSPDATLLQIRGFDRATNRYMYYVNPLFGTTSYARSVFTQPFRLTLDVRINVAPDWETRTIAGFFDEAKPDPSVVLTTNQIRARLAQASGPQDRFGPLVRLRDSLHLSPAQVDSITAIGTEFRRVRDSVYDALAPALAAREGNYGGDAGRRDWHLSLVLVARAKAAAWLRVRAVLTKAQYALLPEFWRTLDEVSPSIIENGWRMPQIFPP